MKKNIISLIVMSLLFGYSSFVFAGEITGIVHEESLKTPLESGTVMVKNASFSKIFPIQLNGSYDAVGIPTGVYTVIANSNGHADTAYKVSVGVDDIVALDFYINTLMTGITVSDNAGRKNGGYQPLVDPYNPGLNPVFKAASIRETGARKISEAVALGPKVFVDENGEISISGGRPTATRTMIDGVYTEAEVPMNAIRYIKVYTGGIPAKYGDCSGGVIVIETKSFY